MRSVFFAMSMLLTACAASHSEVPAPPPVPLMCPAIGDAYAEAVARLDCPDAAPTLVGCWYVDRPCEDVHLEGPLVPPDSVNAAHVAATFRTAPDCTWLATLVVGYCPELEP